MVSIQQKLFRWRREVQALSIAEIQQLFTDMRREYGKETLAVFFAAAQVLHGEFLKNVASCPEFVIAYCQQKLSPRALAKHKAVENALRQASIADAERTLAKLRQAAE